MIPVMERRQTSRPQRVLLVDDSADIREMWRMWLTFWGFLVEEAANGAEAVEKARRDRPDLILMDLWMPVLDGLQATQQIKADPRTAEVPILAVSAQVFSPAAEDAIAAGCETFLAKPVDPDHLLEEIRFSFAKRRARRELD
jgi:CheY-like chemotaxis protein